MLTLLALEAEAQTLKEALGVELVEGVREALLVPEVHTVPELQDDGQALGDAAVEALA